MEEKPRGYALRRGRVSENGRVYLVTAVTRDRQPIFADWHAGRQIVEALKASDAGGRTETLAWVVMPDHLHWLFRLLDQQTLAQTVGWAKGYSARRVSAPGGLWQAGFHDRALRAEEDLVAAARYVVANPLRKGLVARLGDYPLWDAVWL